MIKGKDCVLQVCAFSAEYPGNFIASLEKLEKVLLKRNIRTIYAFSEDAAERNWCREITKRTTVYFLPERKARIRPLTYSVFHRIYRENHISVVHTHFELYDIPATLMAPKQVKVFWHLHDPIQIGNNLHGLLWRIQYGVVGRGAELISVSDYYRKRIISVGFPAKQTRVLLNGIDTDRIRLAEEKDKQFDFLTFGWDYYRKGDDIILQACELLASDGYRFSLLLNGNHNTWKSLPQEYQKNLPFWLRLGEPVEDVNSLFSKSSCFIQASRRETFSYAICEAAYAGLPIICSKIAGVEWATELPTVSFFPSENAEALCSKMKAFLNRENNRREKIEKTRRIIADHYSTTAWAMNVIKLYFDM